MSVSDNPAADLILARQAYRDLLTGKAVVTIIHENERIDYAKADAAKLLSYINLLQQQVSACSRRPVTFRG